LDSSEFLDGTQSTNVVASLYANSVLTKSLGPEAKSTEIREIITKEKDGKAIKALAELNGNKIYLNPKWWWGGEYFLDDLSTVMHELIHNVTGLTDADFESRGFEGLSNVLKTKCF